MTIEEGLLSESDNRGRSAVCNSLLGSDNRGSAVSDNRGRSAVSDNRGSAV